MFTRITKRKYEVDKLTQTVSQIIKKFVRVSAIRLMYDKNYDDSDENKSFFIYAFYWLIMKLSEG